MNEVDNPIIKISLPGIDVDKATPEECSLHSAYSLFKGYSYLTKYYTESFSINNTSPGQHHYITIPHNYNFVPVVFVYYANNGSGFKMLGVPAGSPSVPWQGYKVDKSNLIIDIWSGIDLLAGGAVSYSVEIRYAIFAHDGA